MTDENQETCTSKIKTWIFTFHKAPCFWPKLLRSFVIVILICSGLYTIVTSAFEYFNEPNALVDPERLGQFGDFLGGTLNPIFGFLTVCLLLWSIYIQRKELSLTRDELKKSANALKMQLEISILEYNRKQIEEIIVKKESEYSQLLKTTFEKIEFDFIDSSGTPSTTHLDTLKGIINSQKLTSQSNLNNRINDMIFGELKNDREKERRKKFLQFIELTNELHKLYIELLKITSVEAIRNHIKDCANEKITNAKLTHTIPVAYTDEMLNSIAVSDFKFQDQ